MVLIHASVAMVVLAAAANTQPAPQPSSAPASQPAEPAKVLAPASTPASAPASSPASRPALPTIKLGVFDHGKTFEVAIGQRLVVELPGANDAPWTVAKVDGPAVELVGKVQFKAEKEGQKAGAYLATFQAGQAGQAKVSLKGPQNMVMEFTVKVLGPAGAEK